MVSPPLAVGRQRAQREQAFYLVESLFASHGRQAAVIQALRADPTLSDGLRQAALAIAEKYHPHLPQLYRESSAVVHKPDASAEAYRRALEQLEEACRLEPQNGTYVTTLGIAQYRLGQYEAAIETLARAEKLHASAAEEVSLLSLPKLAFLAMAQHQLGCREQAQATLARLREVMKKPAPAGSPQAAGFLREAETLIEAAPATKK